MGTSLTPFKLINVLQPLIPRNLKEAHACVPEWDLSFLQNIPYSEKMELTLEASFHMFRSDSFMSMEAADQRDIFTMLE